MSAQSLEELTPDRALEMYRPLVEGYEQAMPTLLVQDADNRSVVLQIPLPEGMSGAEGIAAARIVLKNQGVDAVRALFSTEVWMRLSNISGEEIGMDEAVSILYVDRAGKVWSHLARFARTNTGVRWRDSNTRFDDITGDLIDQMRELVR